MIKSIFIINGSGQILIEKHWRGVTGRPVVEFFWEEVCKYKAKLDVPPVIVTPMYYLISVLRHDMFFLATVTAEVSPLMVAELLHRVVGVLEIYFGNAFKEASVQENFATVYQLLEEMLDNGHPLITEPNALTSMVAPPNLAGRVLNYMTGKSSISDNVDAGALSIIPWRSSKVSYVQNEIFFDVVEELDTIIDSNGRMVSSGVYGTILCKCHLSGTPECVLRFQDPSVMQDVSFHPCIRIARFEREKVLSFVPPDGQFELMTYQVKSRQPTAPLYCRPTVTYSAGKGKVDVMVGSKPMTAMMGRRGMGGRGMGAGGGGGTDPVLKEVSVILTFAKEVLSVDVSATVGTVAFPEDKQGKFVVCYWTIGHIPTDKTPHLTGSLTLKPGAKAGASSVTATVRFAVASGSISGLKIGDMRVVNEAYKFRKGMRSKVRSGRFQVRA